MKDILKLVIVGIIMAAFVLFLAFFAVYEDNLVGKGQQDQNISDATGNVVIPFIEKEIHHQNAVDIVNIMLTKENMRKLNN